MRDYHRGVDCNLITKWVFLISLCFCAHTGDNYVAHYRASFRDYSSFLYLIKCVYRADESDYRVCYKYVKIDNKYKRTCESVYSLLVSPTRLEQIYIFRNKSFIHGLMFIYCFVIHILYVFFRLFAAAGVFLVFGLTLIDLVLTVWKSYACLSVYLHFAIHSYAYARYPYIANSYTWLIAIPHEPQSSTLRAVCRCFRCRVPLLFLFLISLM